MLDESMGRDRLEGRRLRFCKNWRQSYSNIALPTAGPTRPTLRLEP